MDASQLAGASSGLSLGQEERRAHEMFAANRRRIYVENAELLTTLDEFASKEGGAGGKGLLVTGESGSGKSALLACWAHRYRARNREAFVIEYYVGATSASCHHGEIIRRVISDIAARYEVVEAIPTALSELEEALPLWLAKVQNEDLIIVVDALNELNDSSTSLVWMPSYLHARIRFIASSSSAEHADEFDRRAWRATDIPTLTTNDRKQIIGEYLRQYPMRHDAEMLDRIANAGATANPLFLRITVDQLRTVHATEHATGDLDELLGAVGIDQLMNIVLDRIERDHGDAARRVLPLVWASRNGLGVDELSALTRIRGDAVQALMDTLEFHIIDRGGLIAFFHDQVRTAVYRRYVVDDDGERLTRRKIARHFDGSESAHRRAVELPWQLWRLDDRRKLEVCFNDLALFETLFTQDDYQLLLYWSTIGRHNEVAASMVTQLESAAQHGRPAPTLAARMDRVGEFLGMVGKFSEASTLLSRALAFRRDDGDTSVDAVVESINHLAGLLIARGKYASADTLLCEALDSLERNGLQKCELFVRCVNNLAIVHYQRRDYANALPLAKKALDLADGLDVDVSVRVECRSLLGAIYFGLNEVDRASALFIENETETTRHFGPKHPKTIVALNNIGTIQAKRQRFGEAQEYFMRAIASWQDLFGPDYHEVALALTNLGWCRVSVGQYSAAAEAYTSAIAIEERVHGKDYPEIGVTLLHLGRVYRECERLDEAIECCNRAIEIFEHAFGPEHDKTMQAHIALGYTLFLAGKTDLAFDIYELWLPRKIRLLGTDDPSVIRAQNAFERIRDAMRHRSPETG